MAREIHYSVHKSGRFNLNWTLHHDIHNYESAEMHCRAAALESNDTAESFFVLRHSSSGIVSTVDCVIIVQAVTGTFIRHYPKGWETID